MKQTKRVTRVTAALNSMHEKDIYSMMLFVLYKLKDNPDFLTLSELCYIINSDNLTKFLRYYGGMTLTIPTLKEFRKIFQALCLYQYVNMDEGDFNDGLSVVASDEFSNDEIKEVYLKISEVLQDYEFKR